VPNRAASNSPHAQAQQWFEQALALHRNGQIARALALYGQVLQIQPAHFDALHLSGIIAVQGKDPAKAVEFIGRAIAVNPRHAAAYYNQGVALQALGRLVDAENSYGRAVALQPDYANAHYNRGVVLQGLEQYQAALACYDQTLALQPDHADACNNRGAVLHKLGQYQAALDSYDRAIALKPAADIYHNRGITLQSLGRPMEALASFERAVALDPNFAEAHYHRGNMLKDARQFQAALEGYDKALVLRPDFAHAWCNRGVVLHDLGQHQAAEASYAKAIALYGATVAEKPDDADAWYNLGNALRDTLQFQAALKSYDRAIALQPDHEDVHWVAGLCRLQTGDFERGWQEHEWRWRRAEKKPLLRNFPQPLWLGAEPLQGKTILLYSEQGLGDTLQFCRYAKQVADLGATVILEARRALVPLLGSLAGVSELVAEGEPLPAFDFQCPLMSLPLAFKTTLASIPAPDRYLAADPGKVAAWRDRLDEKTRLRVGLAWSGSATHKNDLYRSIPLAELVRGLPQGPQYVSLQKELRAADAETLRLHPEILHFGDALHDFADTAALCELLDVVISVDTSIAHLAGALGRPLWLLLPFIAEWRWLLGRADSPWYASARLYRQAQRDDWESVVQKVHDDLAQRVSAAGAASKVTPADAAQNARAHYNRGNALQTQGDWDAAIDHYRRALLLDPDYAEAHNNLGIALLSRGETDAAIASYRQALLLRPDYARAHNNLGNALQTRGNFEAATGHYLDALLLDPNYAEAHNNLGNALLAQGKPDKAIGSYRQALSFRPDYAEAHYNLGNALQIQGKPDDAIASYHNALSFQPYYISALNNMGSALLLQGKLSAAIESYRYALMLQPDYAEAHSNLGNALRDHCELDAALASYRKAISLKPDYADAHSNLLFAMQYTNDHTQTELFAEHLAYTQCFEAPLKNNWPAHLNSREPGKRLKIGYVSPDFRKHSVAYFIESALAHHDREHFDVYCYCNNPLSDEVTVRLKSLVEHWCDIRTMSDEDAARQIRNDGIDILIDLAGHTAENRLPVFARKPAPVQASWLGYPYTTGLSSVDYRISDIFADPAGMSERYYSETIFRLPATSTCYHPPRVSPEVGSLPALALGGITFGSFNNLVKVTHEVRALWARILLATPGSRLMLKAGPLADNAMKQKLMAEFAGYGITAERLILAAHDAGHFEHLDRYNTIDIGLDPFPYNGTTTSFEALWMGVPIVSMVGDRYTSRMGISILSNLGLSEFLADTQEDYAAIATRLAGDMARLSGLRSGLRNRMKNSPLTDGKQFTADLENAYRKMWQTFISESGSGIRLPSWGMSA
jgi:predicted O-linked N-acetylglucosamine transferase (SPINDLY family)